MSRRASARPTSSNYSQIGTPVNFPTRTVTGNDAWAQGQDFSLLVAAIASSITLTLPPNPAQGDQYELRVLGPLNLNTVTVGGNGHQIESATTLGVFSSTGGFSALALAVRYRFVGNVWILA